MSTCVFEQKVDAILWLWSGFSEHPQHQQLTVLEHVAQWLNPSSFIVLDTLSPDVKAQNAYAFGQLSVVHSQYGTHCCYTPRATEVYHYAQALGFRTLTTQPYQTATQRDRVLYLLQARMI